MKAAHVTTSNMSALPVSLFITLATTSVTRPITHEATIAALISAKA